MAEATTTIKRFKSLSLLQRPKKNDIKKEDVNKAARFLQYSPELRMKIYEQAFTRTPIEHFNALHQGPQANSASALMLACHQTHDEAKDLHYKDAVTNLWPHVYKDNHPQGFLSAPPPIIASWRKSRHGKLLKHHPGRVKQLALLHNLTRESQSISTDYIESDILKSSHLKPTDLYLRVCICGSVQWLHNKPFDIMPFCIALEQWAQHFPSLKRIHILYCGQTWPMWLEKSGDDVPFPDIALARHTVRMFSGSNWSVKRVDARTKSWGPNVERDSSQVQPAPRKRSDVEGSEEEDVEEVIDECKLRTVMSWNHAQAHPGESATQVPYGKRDVEVNYYDSRTVLGEKCVRDKPKKTKSSEYQCMSSQILD